MRIRIRFVPRFQCKTVGATVAAEVLLFTLRNLQLQLQQLLPLPLPLLRTACCKPICNASADFLAKSKRPRGCCHFSIGRMFQVGGPKRL